MLKNSCWAKAGGADIIQKMKNCRECSKCPKSRSWEGTHGHWEVFSLDESATEKATECYLLYQPEVLTGVGPGKGTEAEHHQGLEVKGQQVQMLFT